MTDAPAPWSEAKTGSIHLTIPGRPEYVVVVRLATAGIASRMAFSYDDIEDLKLAVGEGCTSAILAGGKEIQVQFDIAADRLDVQIISTPFRPPRSSKARTLDAVLIQCLMDEVHTQLNGITHVIRMTKRVQGSHVR